MDFANGGRINQLAPRTGMPTAGVLDFSASINPLGPPENLRSIMNCSLGLVVHYPDPYGTDMVAALAGHHGASPEQIVVGNGSTEIIYALPRALAVERVVIPVPSYGDYQTAAKRQGLAVKLMPLAESEGFAVNWPVLDKILQKGDLVMIGQPNNPTGRMVEGEQLTAVADRHGDAFFMVDEAYADFIPGYRSLMHQQRPNIVVVRSLSQFYAIPGLRLGYAVMAPDRAGQLRSFLPPWSVGALARSVAAAVVADADYQEQTRAAVTSLREDLIRDLNAFKALNIFDGRANYLLVKMAHAGMDAAGLEAELFSRGIAIRGCADVNGLDENFFRVAVRTAVENKRLVFELNRILQPAGKPALAVHKRKPAVMFLGTSSNAGKSVLTAAMCRILLQDGYRVAPFKAQNMSLNSHVTADGGEMGRAQAVQAQACRLAPDVRMNPVLLKPNSDLGAQVIMMGKPVDNMAAADYTNYKSRVFETVCRAFDSLSDEVDVVVLEGAGSPAEVNLKAHDIVNLAMADYAAATALLVGDIDRGGVFAAFAGTLDVLSESERALIAGFVINRFRGEPSLLEDAIAFTRRHTGLPTFGVVPYVPDLGLPEEDSVSFKARKNLRKQGQGCEGPEKAVEIAVVDLPHISNFTDFDALMMEPDVRLRVIRRVKDMGRPDALILPGSKNTINDLAYLQSCGLTDGILALARDGRTEVVGICGGFQMLCNAIEDPLAVESGSGRIQGFGLLDTVTTMATEKSLRLVQARHSASELPVRGYEIHHGQTPGNDLPSAVVRDDGAVIGLASADRRIWGTYLHGIFDDDRFRRWFVDRLRAARGMAPVDRVLWRYDVDSALDRLAEVVRSHMRISDIYHLAGLR